MRAATPALRQRNFTDPCFDLSFGPVAADLAAAGLDDGEHLPPRQ
jgi:hypothetical protein